MALNAGRVKVFNSIAGGLGLATLLAALWLALPVVQAVAGETRTMRIQVRDKERSTQYVLLPDQRGHVLALVHRLGKAKLDSGETADFEAYCLIEAWMGKKGIRRGHSWLTLKGGSQIYYGWTADSRRNQDNLPSLEGKGDITRGSGVFKGMKGKVTFKGVQVRPTSQDVQRTRDNDLVITYTLGD